MTTKCEYCPADATTTVFDSEIGATVEACETCAIEVSYQQLQEGVSRIWELSSHGDTPMSTIHNVASELRLL